MFTVLQQKMIVDTEFQKLQTEINNLANENHYKFQPYREFNPILSTPNLFTTQLTEI